MRFMTCLGVTAIAVVSIPLPLEAQGAPPTMKMEPREGPLGWNLKIDRDGALQPWDGVCPHPAENPETRTTTVFLALGSADSTLQLSPLLLSYIAQDIARPIMRSDRDADGRLRLRPADDAYPPHVMLSEGYFTLRPDGSLADVDLSNVVHEGFREALQAAFDSVAARGGVGGFDAQGLLEIPLVLGLITEIDTTLGVAPLFTLEMPENRLAMAMPNNIPPPYPEAARQAYAEATLLMTFIVDVDGRPRASSVRFVEASPRVTPEVWVHLPAFEQSIRRSLRRYRYRPAEFLGCKVAMWVQQPFSFRLRR